MQALNAFKQKLFNVKGTVTPLVTLLLHHVIKTDLKGVQVYFVVWQTENVLPQMMSQTKPPLLFSISSLYAAELAPVYFLCEVLNVLWFCWMPDKREASKGITATIMWIMASKQEFICPQHPTNTEKGQPCSKTNREVRETFPNLQSLYWKQSKHFNTIFCTYAAGKIQKIYASLNINYKKLK